MTPKPQRKLQRVPLEHLTLKVLDHRRTSTSSSRSWREQGVQGVQVHRFDNADIDRKHLRTAAQTRCLSSLDAWEKRDPDCIEEPAQFQAPGSMGACKWTWNQPRQISLERVTSVVLDALPPSLPVHLTCKPMKQMGGSAHDRSCGRSCLRLGEEREVREEAALQISRPSRPRGCRLTSEDRRK